MDGWNAMTYEGKDNVLRAVRADAEALFAMAEAPGAWEAPTACTGWQVRDVFGHLVDTTEAYFVAFDAARGNGQAPDALGVRVMAERVNRRATAFRELSQQEMTARLRGDFAKMMEIFQALGPDEWTGLMVPHVYMGPIPAFFYPAFQLMDYGVHAWDVRQGTGRAHGLDGDTADLLVPFMFGLWQATADVDPDAEPFTLGLRVSGRNGGEHRVSVAPGGVTFEPGGVDDLATVIEFDPGSFVLTAFGRSNSGTIRGDAVPADRYLNLFFRI
ncbi:MAG TPA: maleylpyruvate isomerase family mycothiol-dependent enzyme [Actinomycetes bacterium]|nr:maleylpyruvate isomerase family mycothiol-dependent enzyme [Actinomycetes bacterium]